jgi:5-methylthioadenosine/S-adenosylhomocysteine deaminase
MSRHVDLAIHAKWVVPIEPAGALADHVVLVDGDAIVDVVSEEGAAGYLPRAVVTLEQHALLPGLVNAHSHTAMTLLRGIADDVPLSTWLEKHIWPREGRFVSPEFVYDGVSLGAAEMLRGGITCCNDMYFYPDAAARAYQAAGMRAVLGLPILDFPTPYASDADGYLQAGLAARDAFKHAPRLSFMLAPHAPYTVGDATFERIVTYAHQLDLPIQTHLHETQREVDDAIAATGVSPLLRLDRLGVTGPSFVAVHAVHLSDADIELLARQRCHVVHCPTSNLKLASGIAPVAALLASDVNVALGSDGAASNNRQDVLAEMRLATLIAKVRAGDAAALPAQKALEMATLSGARALGLGDSIGSIVAGKKADLFAIDLGQLDDAPLYDPISHLVHVSGRERVTDVWIAGQRIVEGRRLALLDEAALLARARLWQQKLA